MAYSRFSLVTALLLAVVLTGSFVTHTSLAAGGATLYLAPAGETVAPGATLSVAVRVNISGENVNAVQADLTYPTDKLEFIDTEDSLSAFDIDASSTGASGLVSIARGKIGNLTGDVLVTTVRFKVLNSPGAVKLGFGNGSEVDRSSDSRDILTTKTGGTYTISNPAAGGSKPTSSQSATPAQPAASNNPASEQTTSEALMKDLSGSPWTLPVALAALVLLVVAVVAIHLRRHTAS